MYCSECGRELKDEKICPSCNTPVGNSPTQTNQARDNLSSILRKMDIKVKLAVAGVVLLALVFIVYNAVTGDTRQVRAQIIGNSIHTGNGEYIIEKDNISKIDNVIRNKLDDGLGTQETRAYLELDMGDFMAYGQVMIIEMGEMTDTYYDLEYKPLTGISHQQVVSGLTDIQIDISEIGTMDLSDEYIKSLEVSEIQEDLENSQCLVSIDLVYENDLLTSTGEVEIEYHYQNGWWEIVNITSGEFQQNYVEGKDLEFSMEDFMDAYNRGRLYFEWADNKELPVDLNESTLTLDTIEQADMYNKTAVLAISNSTPFYSVEGNLYVEYTYSDEGWSIYNVVLDPDYTFNIEGKYQGWYEVGTFNVVRRNAELEITKVDHRTGRYDGIFSFDTPDDEEGSGSYYVTGYINIVEGQQDEWRMNSEKWIDRPGNYSMLDLSGIIDNNNEMFKGKNTKYSDTFELTRIK